MTHVEQGELQAYLDGEVAAGSRAEIAEHLHKCAECAAGLASLRSASLLFATALRGVAAPAPTYAAMAAVSAAGGPAVRRRAAFSRAALAKAAILVLGFAALASATIPGSPVRAWISKQLHSAGVVGEQEQDAQSTAVQPAAAPGQTNAEAAALSILPVDGRVRIILTDVAADASVRVRLVDSGRALVQATGAAAHARFRTGPGRIEVIGVRNGIVTIDLPRGATDARVEVDGRVLFETH